MFGDVPCDTLDFLCFIMSGVLEESRSNAWLNHRVPPAQEFVLMTLLQCFSTLNKWKISDLFIFMERAVGQATVVQAGATGHLAPLG